MTAEQFSQLLESLRACQPARAWAAGKSLAEVWATCERADWMLWLVGQMADKQNWPTRKQVVLAACACAETSLHLVRKGDKRPAEAIRIARLWAGGRATMQEVRNAAIAAYDADNDAAAAHAAHAAAHAAHAAAAHAAAAHNAAAAAAYDNAAAYDAAAAHAAAAHNAAAAHAAAAHAAAANAAAYDNAAAAAYDAAAAHAAAANAAAANAAAARTKSLKQCADIVRSMISLEGL